ncbi:hypothetical protein WUBG_00056 [Wuchereria bancrofti]|uniref:Uncharacterized protein n=1 Tax=Wuchereria bancrofti TaxID=6293 RepID=J9FNU3_WUCBA|nr:hypothetical protein WUBG_00056 [Wuchereria bancrofti]
MSDSKSTTNSTNGTIINSHATNHNVCFLLFCLLLYIHTTYADKTLLITIHKAGSTIEQLLLECLSIYIVSSVYNTNISKVQGELVNAIGSGCQCSYNESICSLLCIRYFETAKTQKATLKKRSLWISRRRLDLSAL